MSEQFGTLTQRPVHPASPVLLTKNGPLRTFIHFVCTIKLHKQNLTDLKFENTSSQLLARNVESLALPDKTVYKYVPAILRETSEGTSYQIVRLVFRPYTQIRRTICTSVPLRASTRVSPGFTLFRHRSPSFGSQQLCSDSNLSQVRIGR